MRAASRGEEGAAVVEFALMSMLIVTLALYMIFSCEIFQVSIKAQEAEISAAWDISGYFLHDFKNGCTDAICDTDNRRAAINNTEAVIKNDLANLNSFEHKASAALALIMTKTQPFSADLTKNKDGLACAPYGNDQYLSAIDPGEGDRGAGPSGAFAPSKYLDLSGWVACRAVMTLKNDFMLADPFAIFYKYYQNSPEFLPSSVRVCGIGGDPSGCKTQHGFPLLTDEWALEDGNDVPLGLADPTNPIPQDYLGPNPDRYPKYYKVAQSVYLSPSTSIGNSAGANFRINQTWEGSGTQPGLMSSDHSVGDQDYDLGGGTAAIGSTAFKLGFFRDVSKANTIVDDYDKHEGPLLVHFTPFCDNQSLCEDGKGRPDVERNTDVTVSNQRTAENYYSGTSGP